MSKIPKIVFSDFDGTLTLNEKLTPHFFEILNLLQKHHVPLVIVTGRSISWGHFLLTHFPLQDVIVEGGGARVYRDGHFIREELYVSAEDVQRLENFTAELKSFSPKIPLSVDSFGRKTDRAIELVDLLENSNEGNQFQKVEEVLKNHHINFSTSNVHLNFWCGEMSKYMAVEKFLKSHQGSTGLDFSDGVFFGDSLNDQSMFQNFQNSVGVSNIHKVIQQLKFKPSTILQGEENVGPLGVLNYLKEVFK